MHETVAKDLGKCLIKRVRLPCKEAAHESRGLISYPNIPRDTWSFAYCDSAPEEQVKAYLSSTAAADTPTSKFFFSLVFKFAVSWFVWLIFFFLLLIFKDMASDFRHLCRNSRFDHPAVVFVSSDWPRRLPRHHTKLPFAFWPRRRVIGGGRLRSQQSVSWQLRRQRQLNAAAPQTSPGVWPLCPRSCFSLPERRRLVFVFLNQGCYFYYKHKQTQTKKTIKFSPLYGNKGLRPQLWRPFRKLNNKTVFFFGWVFFWACGALKQVLMAD